MLGPTFERSRVPQGGEQKVQTELTTIPVIDSNGNIVIKGKVHEYEQKPLDEKEKERLDVSGWAICGKATRAILSIVSAILGYIVAINWITEDHKYFGGLSIFHLLVCSGLIIWYAHRDNKLTVMLCVLAILNVAPVHDLATFYREPTVKNHLALSASTMIESLIENLPQFYIQFYVTIVNKDLAVSEYKKCISEECPNYVGSFIDESKLESKGFFEPIYASSYDIFNSTACEAWGSEALVPTKTPTSYIDSPGNYNPYGNYGGTRCNALRDCMTMNCDRKLEIDSLAITSIIVAGISFAWALADSNNTFYGTRRYKKIFGSCFNFLFSLSDLAFQVLINIFLMAMNISGTVPENPKQPVYNSITMFFWGFLLIFGRTCWNMGVIQLSMFCGYYEQIKNRLSIKLGLTSFLGSLSGSMMITENAPIFLYPFSFIIPFAWLYFKWDELWEKISLPTCGTSGDLSGTWNESTMTYTYEQCKDSINFGPFWIFLVVTLICWLLTLIPCCKGKRKHFLDQRKGNEEITARLARDLYKAKLKAIDPDNHTGTLTPKQYQEFEQKRREAQR